MTDTNFTPAPAAPAELGIGAIMGETFSLFGRNFVLFFGLSATPFLLVFAVFMMALLPEDIGLGSVDAGRILIFSTLLGLVTGLLYVLIQGVMARAAVAIKTGRGPQLGLAVQATLSGFFPILLLGILYALAVSLGLILVIVPGLYVMAMFYVYVPAIVFERQGFNALGRSAELTKGYRWAVVGVALIVIVIGILLDITGSAIVDALDAGNASGLATTWTSVLMEAVLQGLMAPIGIIASALVFVRLSEIKDGGSAEDLMSVFE